MVTFAVSSPVDLSDHKMRATIAGSSVNAVSVRMESWDVKQSPQQIIATSPKRWQEELLFELKLFVSQRKLEKEKPTIEM